MTKFIATTEKVKVEDYPYSFSLRTTLFDSIEFSPKKGYRHVRQTINPKTGRENAPKKGTYYPLLVRWYNEEGHIKVSAFNFNGDEEINKGCAFIANHFELFTEEEVKYFYEYIYAMAIVDVKATAVYGGSKFEDLKPLYEEFLQTCKAGMREGGNKFGSLRLDSDAINATKPKDYNPFAKVN